MIPRRQLTGAIIAGGRARRLNGLAKGLVSVGGEPIMARQLRLLGDRCSNTFIIGDPSGPYADQGVPVHPDVLPDKGPPGGVHSALSRAATPWVIILGCDLPYLTEALIDGLCVAGDHEVCLYRAGGRRQPLVSCWRQSLAPRIGEILGNSSPGFAGLTASLRVRELEGVAAEAFFNLNTPADLAQV